MEDGDGNGDWVLGTAKKGLRSVGLWSGCGLYDEEMPLSVTRRSQVPRCPGAHRAKWVIRGFYGALRFLRLLRLRRL